MKCGVEIVDDEKEPWKIILQIVLLEVAEEKSFSFSEEKKNLLSEEIWRKISKSDSR